MRLKLILFFLLFGVEAVLGACRPEINFGYNTGSTNFQIFIFENGVFLRSGFLDQTESIPKSDVESEFSFFAEKRSDIFFLQK